MSIRLSLYLSSCSRKMQAEVWSGRKGWGLEVEDYDHYLRPHPGPRTSVGSTLAPSEDGPHPSTPNEGVTLTVLNQRQGTILVHRVSHCSLREA